MRRRGDGADVVVGQHHACRRLDVRREDDLGPVALDGLDHLVDGSGRPRRLPLVGHRAGGHDGRLAGHGAGVEDLRPAVGEQAVADHEAAPPVASWRATASMPYEPPPGTTATVSAAYVVRSTSMMSCITPTKRCDMWLSERSVKTTEYSSSPSGSTSGRGRVTSADCHSARSHGPPRADQRRDQVSAAQVATIAASGSHGSGERAARHVRRTSRRGSSSRTGR